MDLRVDDLRLYVELVDAKSFSEAARRLGVPRPSVSRRLAALEREVGVRLLWRTTRRMRVTDVGVAFYDRCRRVLESLGDAERVITEATAAPSGRLRMSGPHMVGPLVLGDAIERYMARYPEVTIDLHLLDHKVDVRAEGYDLAVRLGAVLDETLVARKVGVLRQVLCASPSYLAEHGHPRSPAELSGHRLLAHAIDEEAPVLRLSRKGRVVEVRPTVVMRANAHALLRSAALAGHGMTVLPAPMCQQPIEHGALVPVLPAWSPGDHEINVVYAGGPLVPVKLSAFLDIFEQTLDTLELPCDVARPKRRRRAEGSIDRRTAASSGRRER